MIRATLFALAATMIAFAAEPLAASEPAMTWAPPFYAYCMDMGVPGRQPLPLPEQAALLHELGYDGIGYDLGLDHSLDANLAALDEAGLKLYMVHTRVNLAKPKAPFQPQLFQTIAKLKGRPATICVLLQGCKPGAEEGMEPAVKALRAIGACAAKAGLRVSIYHHVHDWTESLPFALEVAKKVDRPNVGVSFNLCHWLRVEGKKDYRPLILQNADKIFSVTICGATQGATTWAGGLIQPLDCGDFDTRALFVTLRAAGYQGPIGLMCYGVPDDLHQHLARSMKVWRSWFSDR